MNNPMDSNDQEPQRKTLQDFYNIPANLRLKYIAIALCAIIVAIFMSMIIWHDDLSPKTYLFMRGCAGLVAIAVGIIVGALSYRVFSAFIKQK